MELKNLVRFSSHRRPFLVSDHYCDNPDCGCTDVFLKFTEIGEDGKPLAACTLSAPPAWDALAAARGRLYVTTTDGKVTCLKGK